MDDDRESSWLTLDEAGHRLGLSKDALRKRITRGRIEGRRGNDGSARVLVTSAMLSGQGEDTAGHDRDAGEVGRLLVQIEDARDRTEMLAREVGEARERAAKAEGELAAEARRAADLSAALVLERERADRLAAEMREMGRPVLLRLLEAFRRR